MSNYLIDGISTDDFKKFCKNLKTELNNFENIDSISHSNMLHICARAANYKNYHQLNDYLSFNESSEDIISEYIKETKAIFSDVAYSERLEAFYLKVKNSFDDFYNEKNEYIFIEIPQKNYTSKCFFIRVGLKGTFSMFNDFVDVAYIEVYDFVKNCFKTYKEVVNEINQFCTKHSLKKKSHPFNTYVINRIEDGFYAKHPIEKVIFNTENIQVSISNSLTSKVFSKYHPSYNSAEKVEIKIDDTICSLENIVRDDSFEIILKKLNINKNDLLKSLQSSNMLKYNFDKLNDLFVNSFEKSYKVRVHSIKEQEKYLFLFLIEFKFSGLIDALYKVLDSTNAEFEMESTIVGSIKDSQNRIYSLI